MDTTSHRNTYRPGTLVTMDGLLWTVDRETPTSGVYRLLLAKPCVDWPAGQIGFGHHTRLALAGERCPSCDRPSVELEWSPCGGMFACPCGMSGDEDELAGRTAKQVPTVELEGAGWFER